MHQTIQVYTNQKNLRAAGICYMNLGCMLAAQDISMYDKANQYFAKAELI